MVDASDRAIGGVVQQLKDNAWQPDRVFSRKLLPAETRYSTFGRELLAVYLTIKHFRYMLDGRTFCVFTDHKPLIHVFHARPDRHSPREIRHLDYISQFTTDLRHVKGTENVVADTLSRPPMWTPCIPTLKSISGAIAQAQQTDPELQTLLNSDSSFGMVLQKVPLIATGGEIVCDVSHDLARPYVPRNTDARFSMQYTGYLTRVFVRP